MGSIHRRSDDFPYGSGRAEGFASPVSYFGTNYYVGSNRQDPLGHTEAAVRHGVALRLKIPICEGGPTSGSSSPTGPKRTA